MAESSSSPPPGWIVCLRSRFGRSGIALLFLIGLICIASLSHVIHGARPWGREVTKRVSQGMPLRAREYGIIGVWWGCAAASVISAALLLSARAWMPGGRIKLNRVAARPEAPGAFCTFALVALVAIAASQRVPRLGQSLWNDEEYAMRRFAHGSWEQKEGIWTFDPVTWDETLFEQKHGNNHLLNSLFTRCALGIWRIAAHEPREAFSETALRVPAFVAGLLTLLLLADIGAEMGMAWVGIGAAGLMAFHPWHVRYAAEGKGYSLLLFFACVALLGLIRAIRNNKIAAWLCFAMGQAACLLSFAGSLYLVMGMNGVAVFELLKRGEWRRISSLAAFNLLAAIPVLVWFLPSVPQLMEFLNGPGIPHLGMGKPWLEDAFTHLVAGVYHDNPEPELHRGTSWMLQQVQHAFYFPFFAFLLPALTISGVVISIARGSAARVTVFGLALGGVVSYVHTASHDQTLMVWYLIYLLIPLGFSVCLALARLAPSLEPVRAGVIMVFVACYAAGTSDARSRVIQYDRQPMRQTVASIRDSHPEAMTAVFGVSDRQTLSYDPRVKILENEADLDAALVASQNEGRPLFVYFCGRTESGSRKPDLMKRVLDPAAFTHVQDFPGLEAMFSYQVYQAVKAAPPGVPAH